MYEEGSGKGAWIGFVIAAIAFIVFGVLWYLRGDEIERMQKEIAAANGARQRLESEARDARSDLDRANRKAGDLENMLNAETRRAADAASQAERRLRRDAEDYERRLAEANRKFTQEQTAHKRAADAELASLKNDLERVKNESAEAVELAESEAAAAKERASVLAAQLAEAKEAAQPPEEESGDEREQQGSPTGEAGGTATDSEDASPGVAP